MVVGGSLREERETELDTSPQPASGPALGLLGLVCSTADSAAHCPLTALMRRKVCVGTEDDMTPHGINMAQEGAEGDSLLEVYRRQSSS